MEKTPKWLPDGSGIDPDSLPDSAIVETEHGEWMGIAEYKRWWAPNPPIVRVCANITPPRPDPRRNVLVVELLAAIPESALSRSSADNLADTLLAALDEMDS